MSDSVRPHRQQPTRLPRSWDSPGKNTGVGCHFLLQCMKVKSEREVTQSCPTLSDPLDCSPPGSSNHGIFQARVLEWGAIAFSELYCYAMLVKRIITTFCWTFTMCHTQSPYLLPYTTLKTPICRRYSEQSLFLGRQPEAFIVFFTLGKESFPGYTVSKWQTPVTAA